MQVFVPIIWIALVVFAIASMWKVFTKAGQPGWTCIIPIYNQVIMLEIAGKPTWWIILFFIPVANLIVSIIMCIAIAENFGKGTGFGLGLAFLGIIFFPILAFGDAQYGGAAVVAPPVATMPPAQIPPSQM